jgi:transposase
MAIKLRSKEYDGLRKRCIELLAAGHKSERVSEMLGCTSGWVSKTKKRYAAEGEAGLLTKKPGGQKSRLTEEQIQELLLALQKGALSHGFSGDIWDRKRVAAVILKLFGEKYDPTHVGRILKKAGWTKQKPQVKARQQQAEAVEKWYTQGLPAIKKKPIKKSE